MKLNFYFFSFSSREEQYLRHFAGQEGGKSPIGWRERWSASNAQKHPIGNTICSSIAGVAMSAGLTAGGTLLSPLLRAANEIQGRKWDVCAACAGNAYYLLNASGDLRREFYDSPIFTALNQAGRCALDMAVQENCRVINYVGNWHQFVEENALAISAVGLALMAGIGWTFNRMYEANEVEAELALINKLEERYNHSADFLRAKILEVGNDQDKAQEVGELAKAILANRTAIEKEVRDLKLPSLTVKDVRALTRPLFKAAKEAHRTM